MAEKMSSNAVLKQEALTAEPHWFVLHVRSGSENSAVENIKRVAGKRGVISSFHEFNVPSMATPPKVGSKNKKPGQKVLCPGYLFIRMQMSDEVLAVIDEVSGSSRANRLILGFLPKKSQPTPLSQAEYEKMIVSMTKVADSASSQSFTKGDVVKVKSGSFRGFKGMVADSVTQQPGDEQPKIKILINVLGRETTVEVPFSDVEKV